METKHSKEEGAKKAATCDFFQVYVHKLFSLKYLKKKKHTKKNKKKQKKTTNKHTHTHKHNVILKKK
jgi:hypothetical protein